MTKEQQLKLRSILSIDALLRVTLDWDQEDVWVIITTNTETKKVLATKMGTDYLSNYTVLPKMHTEEEMKEEIDNFRFPMYSLRGITLKEYKEIYQTELLNSI